MLKWSSEEFSTLPWRVNRSLFGTLVSEIMLQQTTVATVLNHYPKFIKKYNTPKKLAAISEEEILLEWKGLGYYRRARNLLNASKQIVEEHAGKLPLEYEVLLSIKGIGEYTANAILSIGAHKRALCIDANLERILARFYGIEEEKGAKLMRDLKNKFETGLILREIDDDQMGALAEAFMDTGRIYCQANKVDCKNCPLSKNCIAYKKGNALDLPISLKKSKKVFFDLELLRIIVKKKGTFMAYQKNNKQWLAKQYELPTFLLSTQDKALKQYPLIEAGDSFQLLPTFKTSITKYKITNRVLQLSEGMFKRFLKKHDLVNDFTYLKEVNKLSTASSKALDL